MFGSANRYGRQNGFVPDIASIPAAAIDLSALANPAPTPSEPSPLAMTAWARTAGRNAPPIAPDVPFSPQGSSTPSAMPHDRRLPPEVIALAQAAQRNTGVPASVSIAQWIWESGWGKHTPKDSNNYFGVKETNIAKPCVTARTKEANPNTGALEKTYQRFRQYSSPEESWAAHAKLLSADPRYAKAMRLTQDPDRFVDAIAGIYAPYNKKYAASIKNTMKSHNLYDFDVAPPNK